MARAQARIRENRSATLAALEQGTTDVADVKPVEKVAEKPVEKAEAKPTIEVEADAEDTDTDTEVETDTKVEAETTVDTADQNKRLAALNLAEKRSRDKVAKERSELAAAKAEIDREKAALAAERAELDAYRKARERAKLDPVALLEAAGVDDLGYAARMAFAKANAEKDPANREAAARMQREREHSSELESTKKRLEELENKLTAKEQQTLFDRQRDAYVDATAKQIGEEAPLLKAFATKNPTKLRAKLWETTQRLIDETGDVPDPSDVIAEYEKTRRDELEELGVDFATLSTTTPKKNPQAADKKTPAKTLGNDLSTPRVPRPTKSDKEHRAETLSMLESGKLE